MADNLEKYFKKHLSDETPGEDNWNVPSDKVWENALPKIRIVKGLFIPLKYLYLLGAIMIVGMVLIFWLFVNPETPSETEANITPKTENQTEESITDEDKSQQTVKSKQEQQATVNNTEGLALEAGDIDVQSGQEFKTTIPSLDQDETSNLKQDQAYLSVEKDQIQETVLDDITENDKEKHWNYYLSPLSVTQFTGNDIIVLSSIQYRDTTGEIDPLIQEKKLFYNKGKFGLGAYYAPTFSNTFVSGEMNTGNVKTGNDFLYSGNYGIELKYYLTHRLVIRTGLSRSQVKSWSESKVDFAYDTSTEYIMQNGEKENASIIPMRTPFGKIDTEITYRFPGEENIPDGEMMNSILDTHQDIEYLSIPLGVEYNITPFSLLNWFAEGGIRYNYASADATRFSSRVLHFGEDMQVVNEEIMNHPTYKSSYFDFYLGTGVHYQFSEKFLIIGSARYFRNISQVNFQDNLSTNVQNLGLKFGFIYFF